MPGKDVYEIEAVPVHTGGGLDQAEPGTVMGTVVGAPGASTTLNGLAAGYGGDGEAGWEPAPARRRSMTGRITLCTATTVLVAVAVVGVVAVATPVDEGSSGTLPPSGSSTYVGDDGEQREGPSPPSPPPAPPPPPEPEFAVTLNAEIAAIPPGSRERQTFERQFAADVAASLGTTADRIRVTGITAGSITVSFQVLDTPAHLDVIGTLIERRPALAGAEFQTAVAMAPADGTATGERASCTSRRSCATLATPDMVAERTSYSWVDIESPANLVRVVDWEHPSNSWPADDGFVTVPLQFELMFYGLVETAVSIGTNGYLTFGEMAHYPFGNTLVIPTPGGDVGGQTVDGLLAVLWTDLDPSAGGAVYHQGNPGQLIVTWHTVPYFNLNRTISSSSTGSTFQAILHRSGVIAMQYESIEHPDLQTEDGTGHYPTPSIGFENHDGSKGVQVAYGWDELPAEESAWLVRAGVAKWVADRPEHSSDSPGICGESHLESHLFSNRIASRHESLDERGTCHGADDSVTSGWEHAANLCGVLGARLCTLAELENGETAASGCSHDNEQTWALDAPDLTESGDQQHWILPSCPDGSHWATSQTSGVDTDVPGRTCVQDDSNLAVRCCADAVVGTPCAMPPYTFITQSSAPPPPTTGMPPIPIATPVVTTSEASIEGHTTLLLSLQLSDEAQNVYALHGGSQPGSLLYFPPAYQVAAPFGVHVGGVPRGFLDLADSGDGTLQNVQWDSWLTLGLTEGNEDNAIATIGINFSDWDDSTPLTEDPDSGGAVFCMNPDLCPTNGGSLVVIAQLTVQPPGRAGSTMTATMGLQGRSATVADDWTQDVVFQL
jgi:hypothetical protein